MMDRVTAQPKREGAGRDAAVTRFADWEDMVARSYTALTVSQPRGSSGKFRGRIRILGECDGTTLTRIDADRQTVRRRRADIQDRPCEAVFLNFQIKGSCRVLQAGIETLQPPGAVVLLDARRPFRMQFDSAFQQLCLHLPLASLPEGSLQVDRASGRVRVFDEWPDCLAGRLLPYGAGLEQSVLDRVLALFAPEDELRLSDQHLALIQAYVIGHVEDVSLSVGQVLSHFRISERYLHRLFERSGTTFGRFVLAARLDHARRLIDGHPQTSFAEIATLCGFQSQGHFSRTFRARFGAAPSVRRAGRA